MSSLSSSSSLPTCGAPDPRALFRRDFDKLDGYTPVQPLDVLAAELQMEVSDLVKLDANENLYGPLPEVRARGGTAAAAAAVSRPPCGETSLSMLLSAPRAAANPPTR
jgi:hypothetical protein